MGGSLARSGRYCDGIRILLFNEAGFSDVEIIPVGHPGFPFGHTVVARIDRWRARNMRRFKTILSVNVNTRERMFSNYHDDIAAYGIG